MAMATNQFIVTKHSNKSHVQEHMSTFIISHVRSCKEQGYLWQVEMQVFPVPWLQVKNMTVYPLCTIALITFFFI